MGDKFDELLNATPLSHHTLANGESIAFRDFRSHQTDNVLVCIHGNGSSHETFIEFIAHSNLDQFRVIAVDMRGFGDSTYKTRINSLAELADDIHELCVHLKLVRPAFIGWSTGGGVALALATRFPALPRAVFLLSSVAADGLRSAVMTADGKLAHPPAFNATKESAQAVMQSPFFSAFYSQDAAMSQAMWAAAAFSPGKCPAADSSTFRRIHRSQLKQRPENRLDVYWALMSFNVTPIKTPSAPPSDALQQLRCPVVVLHGPHDRVLNFEHAKALATVINLESWAPNAPKFKFHALSTGHMAPYEDIEELAAAFRKEWDELPAH